MTNIYSPIGKCIYCGKTENETKLKKEHIVPYSLAGKSVLPKASCGICESITSAFEGKCVSTMYKLFRLRFNIQTRRKNKRAKSRVVPAIVNGESKLIDLPVDGLIGVIGFVHFPMPGILKTPGVKPSTFEGTRLSVMNVEPKNKKRWKQENISSISSNINFDINSYALMMAKIAHCVSVGCLGINNFDHFLPDYIVKQKTKGLSYFVGGLEDLEPPVVLKNHHQITWDIIQNDNDDYLVSVKIRLFSYLGGPTAHIITGKTDEKRLDQIKKHLRERN